MKGAKAAPAAEPADGASQPAQPVNSRASKPVKEPKKHACSHCGLLFGRPRNARIHEATHFETEKEHVCEHCGKAFTRIYELRRHKRTAHRDIVEAELLAGANGSENEGSGNVAPAVALPRHVCDRCGAEFSRNDALIRHVRRSDKNSCVSENTKPGKVAPDGKTCTSCNVTFSRRDALMRHIKRMAEKGCGPPGPPGGNRDAQDYETSDVEPMELAPVPLSFCAPTLPNAATATEGCPDMYGSGHPHFPYPSAVDSPSFFFASRTPDAFANHPSPMDVLAFVATPMDPVTPADTSSFTTQSSGNPLHMLYPEFPPELLPPPGIVEILLDYHRRYDGVIHYLLHYPTLLADTLAGRASVGILATMMWGTLRVLDSQGPTVDGFPWARLHFPTYRADIENFCLGWIEKEWLACQGEVGVKRLEDLARALVFGRCATLAMGLVEAHRDYHLKLSFELFPRLKAGQLPGDLGPRPKDTLGWIRAEERTRLCSFLALSDIVISESIAHSRGIVTDDVLIDPVTGVGNVPWTNMAIPCPDVFLDSVSTIKRPIPEADETAITMGVLYLHHTLPFESKLRRDFVATAIGGILTGGHTRSFSLLGSVWRQLGDYVRLCAAKKYLLCSPPETDLKAVAAHKALTLCLEDYWDHMPENLAQLDTNADGEGLRTLAATFWGDFRAFGLVQSLVFQHMFALLLHSPYDIVDTFRYNVSDKSWDSALESWPFSESFVMAEAHAMTISRLIRSGIKMFDDAHRGIKADVRNLPPIWVVAIVRACWVHVIAIRKLRHLLRTTPLPAPSLEGALQSVSTLLEDVDATISGLNEYETVWKHNEGAIHVVMGLVKRDSDDVWIKLTNEEIKLLKGLRGVKSI